ncbi:MAG: PPC domain-containing protein [Deltaproteobacteria bacterium]|nr:PPC domain-containing protein [Deltaproteobacteria bacterium]
MSTIPVSRAFRLLPLLAGLSACGGDLEDGECRQARDCSSGQVCVAGRCQAGTGPTCARDTDCAIDEFCDVGTCRRIAYVPCADDTACPSDQHCDGAMKVCMPGAPTGCSSDATCGAGRVCEAGGCAPGCAQNGSAIACNGDQKCNATTGRCEEDVPSCTTDASCSVPAAVCEASRCVPGCAEVGGISCAQNQSCNATTGRCENLPPPACSADSECGPPARICESSACSPGCGQPGAAACGTGKSCNMSTGRCEPVPPPPCTTDAQCGAPASVCNSGACVPGCGRAGAAACTNGQSCNASTGRCEVPTPACTTDAQCGAPARICTAGACVPGCGRPGAAACTGGTACNSANGHCEDLPPPCTQDAQCAPPATICQAGACVPGCGAGGACGADQTCEVSTGHCIDLGPVCASDLECASPSTVCELALGRCVAGCSATGCNAPEVCDPATGHCSDLTCPADAYEPNETAQDALAIATGTVFELTTCPVDVDYFGWIAEAGDAFEVTVRYSVVEGDIDATLYDPSGLEVASARTRDDDDTMSHTARDAGAYIVGVQLFRDLGPVPGNLYDLELQITCAPDAFEPNDDEGASQTLTPGDSPGLRLCTGDEDWFAIDAADGDSVTITASFTDGEGDLDLELFDASGNTIATSAGVGDEEIVTATGPGPYYLHVLLYADDGGVIGNTYSLNVDVVPPPCSTDAECGAPALVCNGFACVPGCAEAGSPIVCSGPDVCEPLTGRCVANACWDRFEVNDSSPVASVLAAGVESSLRICSTEADWYGIDVPVGQTLTVSASFLDAEGDVDLELYDPAGLYATGSYGVLDSETVALVADQPGQWLARIILFQDEGTVGNSYDLSVTLDASCPSDPYEPNPSTAPAYTGLGDYRYLSLCPGDEDFYEVYLFAGETLTVSIAFAHAEGDIDLVLFDAAGNELTSSRGVTDAEQVTHTADADGLFSIRTFLYSDMGSLPGNTYSMSIGY